MNESEVNITNTPNADEAGAPKARKHWKDLSRQQQTRIVVQVLIQLALMILMLWDLNHRPADQVKGNKRLWFFAAFVQPFGPIAYFAFGRKRNS